MTSPVPDPSPELLQRALAVRQAAGQLAQTSDAERQAALEAMAVALEQASEEILAANAADRQAAEADGLPAALAARLVLDGPKLAAAVAGVRQVAALSDPLGQRQLHTELDQGLVLERITVPLGVVGVIFEARPDALVQIAALAVRSGNGALLKGAAKPAAVAPPSMRPCSRAWPPVRCRRRCSICSRPVRRASPC